MLFCVTQPRLSILWIPGPMVTSARAGSARSSLGMGFLRVVPGAAGRRLAVPLLVEFCLRPGREFGVGQGLALGAVRFSGGSPAERAVRPLLVVDVLEFGELFVELVDRGRQGTGGEPLLQGAVVAFDLALRLGVAGPSVALAHAHQRERAFETPRGGADRSGGVHGAVVGERPGGDAVFGARLKGRWIGNGVLDRFLEDGSLFGEFLRTPVSEGGVESLVVGPPHIVVEVGA